MAQISHREFSVSCYIIRYWPLVTERSNQCIDSVTFNFVPNPFPIIAIETIIIWKTIAKIMIVIIIISATMIIIIIIIFK